MSKKRTARGAEVKEPEEGEGKPLTKADMIKDIKSNRLIPNEYKKLLIMSLDIPERVGDLENIVGGIASKIDGIGDSVVAKINQQAAARDKSLKEDLAGLEGNQGGGGSRTSGLVERLLIRMLAGGGSSSMDKFFWNLGQRTFFEGIAWQETFMNEQAKVMGREFMKDWKQRTKKIESEFAKVGGKKE